MRKTLALLLLASLLAVSLCGCAALPLLMREEASPTAAAPEGTDAPVEPDPTAVPNRTAGPDLTEEPDPTAEPAPEPTETPAQAAELAHGTWEGLTFTSEFAGLSLTLPSDAWTIATDEELAELMDIGTEATDLDEMQQVLAKLLVVQDMMAQNSETGESILLQYENLGLQAGGETVTTEDYADLLVDTLLATDALPYTVDEPRERTICGRAYIEVPARVEEYGLSQSYFVRREGDYMVELVLTAFGDTGIDALLALFAEAA